MRGFWNSRTRTKEPFKAGPIVRIYVCGITPYATTHLGHGRTYLVFDVLIREIERRGHSVRYTQNVTDVDDPLFDKAQQLGISVASLAQECTRIFQDDLAALRIRPPDFYPRASDEIAQMQEIIGTLISRGHAYASGDKVYYRVRSFPSYGGFSRLSREQMLAVAADRGEDPTAGQGRPTRFHSMEAVAPRGGVVVEPVGNGSAGVAHRVLGDGDPLPGGSSRRPRRWQ